MPVAEYKLHRTLQKHITIPPFINNGGNWYSILDHTYIGWVDSNAEYYVPDTILTLNKQQFIERQLEIHRDQPWARRELSVDSNGGPVEGAYDSSEVPTVFGAWYDEFVTQNQG